LSLPDLPSIQESKQQAREKYTVSPASIFQSNLGGKTAEQIRRLPGYKKIKQVFVSPEPALTQVRINCLVDGKELIMPTAGLKEGFFLLTPFSIPFRDLGFAVSLKGVIKHGKRMKIADLSETGCGLCVGIGLAADRQGTFLGDGMGFFDLSYGILSEYKGLLQDTVTCIVVEKEQILSHSIARAPWDVQADYIVTANDIIETESIGKGKSPGRIYWEFLPEKRIRKITPLWQLTQ
jgi:5-formyltetrahydrofolate cyclo-ligase